MTISQFLAFDVREYQFVLLLCVIYINGTLNSEKAVGAVLVWADYWKSKVVDFGQTRHMRFFPSFIFSCTLSLAVDFSAWLLSIAQTNVSATPNTALLNAQPANCLTMLIKIEIDKTLIFHIFFYLMCS